MSIDEVHNRFPVFLAERALPASDADALLRRLKSEAQTWTQDEWWIAGENRLAPRLTTVYEITRGGEERHSVADEALDDDDADDDDSYWNESRAAMKAAMKAAAVKAGEAAMNGLKHQREMGLGSDSGGTPTRNALEWFPTYCVANLYRNGRDTVGAHSDRLTSLGPLAVIVGYSLGRVRVFRLKTRWPKDDKDAICVDIPLPHNSMCVMLPGCQELWTHEILGDGAADAGTRGGNADGDSRKTTVCAFGPECRVSLTFRKKIDAWDANAPICVCGRRCVLKTRRGDGDGPAFLDIPGNVVPVKNIGAHAGTTPVTYYYTCDTANGGKPCAFYRPIETRRLCGEREARRGFEGRVEEPKLAR
jgi:alkylated DNA repair dioxygenase AlkB